MIDCRVILFSAVALGVLTSCCGQRNEVTEHLSQPPTSDELAEIAVQNSYIYENGVKSILAIDVRYSGSGYCLVQDNPRIVVEYDQSSVSIEPPLEGLSYKSLAERRFPRKYVMLYGMSNDQTKMVNQPVRFERELERDPSKINGEIKYELTMRVLARKNDLERALEHVEVKISGVVTVSKRN
jgi:hypothetical protein